MDSYQRRSMEEAHGSFAVQSIEDGGVDFPALFDFTSRLLNDRDLPQDVRPLISSSLGALCLPYSILPDEQENALAVAYLVASLARRIAIDRGHQDVVERNWPHEDTRARDHLSELIRRGNEELTRRQLNQVFDHVGFEEAK